MPTLRRAFTTLALAMLAAAAVLLPTTATAEPTPIEIVDEHTQQHCDTTQPPQCHLLAESIGDITLEAFGAVRTRCSSAFELQLDEDGTGQIIDQTLTGPECLYPPCGGSAPTPWDVYDLVEEDGELYLTFELCITDPLFGNIVCELTAHVEVLSHTAFVADTAPPLSDCAGSGGLLHFTGEWTGGTEADAELEVVHL